MVLVENNISQSGGQSSEGRTDVFKIPDTAETIKLEPGTVTRLHKLADIMERMNLSEYLNYMRMPHRVIWLNFVSGIARGLGFAVGMTILFGLLLYVLGRMVDIPLIGKYVAKIVSIVQQELRVNR
jgi:hypothetical protein